MSEDIQREIPWDYCQRVLITRLLESDPAEIEAFLRRSFDYRCFTSAIRPQVIWLIEQYTVNRRFPLLNNINLQYPGFSEQCLVLLGDRDEYEKNRPTLADALERLRDAVFTQMYQALLNKSADEFNNTTKTVDDLWGDHQKGIEELSTFKVRSNDVSATLADSVDAIIADVEEAQNGRRWGIPLPIPFFYHAVMGGQPGDVTIVVGRPGVGKTFLGLQFLVTAITGNPYFFTPISEASSPFSTDEVIANAKLWRTRTLCTSMEMPIEALRRRIAALITKIAYPQVRSGKFMAGNLSQFKTTLEKLKVKGGVGDLCWLAGGIRTTTDLFAQANAFDAKLVIVDGFYLMSGVGEKRWEIVQSNVGQIRAHARITGQHYILISQIDSNSDRIAFSQAIEQDASNILKIEQSAAEKNNNQVRMSSRKVRDGVSGQEYLFNWDISTGRFSQIRPAPSRIGPTARG